MHHDSSPVTMETGKPGLASAAAHMSSVAAQTERRMEVQAPLTALYIHTVPALPSQPLPQPPLAAVDPTALHLTMPPLYSKETLPFLTLHIASGLQPGLSVTTTPPASKPKSSGKHLCPHCGRDCMKPSVLEKHLRCHTGERPYPCNVCGVSFKTQSNLYKHKRTQAHARLSSESEQSTMGSLDSTSYPTETTSLSVDERSDESVGVERDTNLPAAQKTPVVTQTLECNEKILCQKIQEHAKPIQPDDKQNTVRPSPVNRHVVLQRQEATLFSKQWESSVSNSKSQSHESTDSGFSESSELYPSPGSLLPDHSMDSLTETTTEHVEETTSHQHNQEDKVTAKEQENRSLEERITKLISQNSAVVEDKHLENVRPRKTVLSKQGSIDLPMPYTYKDSFHFDMRISKMSNSNRKPGLYNSVPTQQSTNAEHAPLIRSNSLPFSVSLLQPEQSCPTSSSYHRDYATLFRRGSAGQINPTGFSIKSVNQQSSTHRPLVRQAAVDCNHATDALFKNSSVEEACTSSLRCHGEAGDICGETGNRKFRRKKAQKFAYNKWYMYGGGTFKKLYEMERAGENSAAKGTKSVPNPEVIQSLQKRLSAGHCETTVVSSPNLVRSATVHSLEAHSVRLPLMPGVSFNSQPSHILASSTTQRMPLRRNLSLSVLPLSFLSLTPNLNLDPNKKSEANTSSYDLPCSASQSHVNIPSDRKKQRTDEKTSSQDLETNPNLSTPHTCTIPLPHLSQINIGAHSANVPPYPSSKINVNAPLGANSPAKSISTAVQSSFMPKYQLKLPNTSDFSSCSSVQVGSKPKHDIPSASVPTLPFASTNSGTSNTTHQNASTMKNCSSTQTQSMLCTASQINVMSPVVHHCPVADTKTTASLRNSHVGHFSTIMQSPSFGSVAPITLSTTSVTFTPIHRTQSSPAAFTAFTPTQQQPTSQKGPLVPQSNADTNIPMIPCQIVPGQQTAPKVFHVQTADLQICFQIISDEQLALIEPQIEKQTNSSHPQTVQVPASANEVTMSTALESTDQEISHRQCESNKEVGTLNQDSAKPSMYDESEKEQPTVHMSQATGQSPALIAFPHNFCHTNKVGKHSSSMGVEVSTAACRKDPVLEKSQIPQKELALLCNVGQEQHTSHVKENKGESLSQTLSDEDKPGPANVTSTSHCTRNNGRTNCDESCTKYGNEDNMWFGNLNKSVTRSNLQLSMVSLSLSQTNLASEREGHSEGPTLSHVADSKQTPSLAAAATELPTLPASTDVPDHSTGSDEGRSAGSVELQSDSGAQQKCGHNPLGTCREHFTNMQLDNVQAVKAGDRADSIPNCWPSGQQHLLPLSQPRSGMCGHPPQSSGMDPEQSHSNHFGDPQLTLLVKANSNLSQHTESGTNTSQANPSKPSQSKTVSSIEVGCQEEEELFRQQDQRQPDGAVNTAVNSGTTHLTTEFMSQSHINENTGTYQSAIFVNPPRQTNAVYSEHMCPEELPQPCDKFSPLFGVGSSFSYSPGDPLSGAVRVVQSSMDVEDSSSDDEGKLIIEL